MEIRNLTPMSKGTSFGMALKVKPEDVENFTKFINSSGYKKNLVERGLTQFVKEQAKNKFADIQYDVTHNSFTVVPKDGASSCFDERRFANEGFKPTSLEKAMDFNDAECEAVKDKSGFKQLVAVSKILARSAKAVFDTAYRNSQEILPANLLDAGKYANKINKETEQVAKIGDILNQG